MNELRRIKKVFESKQTVEGGGVHLKRALGFSEVPLFDPFLLLDDFRSNNPAHYTKGFPWLPYKHPTKAGHTVLAYIIEVQDCFCMEKQLFAYET